MFRAAAFGMCVVAVTALLASVTLAQDDTTSTVIVVEPECKPTIRVFARCVDGWEARLRPQFDRILHLLANAQLYYEAWRDGQELPATDAPLETEQPVVTELINATENCQPYIRITAHCVEGWERIYHQLDVLFHLITDVQLFFEVERDNTNATVVTEFNATVIEPPAPTEDGAPLQIEFPDLASAGSTYAGVALFTIGTALAAALF